MQRELVMNKNKERVGEQGKGQTEDPDLDKRGAEHRAKELDSKGVLRCTFLTK